MASDDDVSAQQRPPPSFNSTTDAPASPTSRASLEASGDPSAFVAFVHPFRERGDIVQPLAWPAKCNNSSYNPNTVARDVLLAVGQHPDRPGLNHHLVGLKDHFKYVDDNSDLSTLRWDLINPGAFTLKQANMPPTYGQQNAAVANYRSPFGTGPGSSSSSGSGSVRQSSGYSSNAQGEPSSRPMYQGSMNHSHPEQIRPQGYSTSYASVGNGTGTYGLSHRPSFSGSHGQSSTQPKSTTAPRLILSPSPEPALRRSENNVDKQNSHSHGGTSSSDYGSQRPVQTQRGSSSSRFGYPEKPIPSTSQSQGGSSSINHGRPQGSIPPPVKAPFRASANIAHPSHYQTQHRQSNLQFSSTPNPAGASPRSSLQVVVPTSPAKFYGKTHSMTEARPYLSDGTSSSPRRGRPPKGLEPIPTNVLPKKRGRPFANKVPVEQTPKKRGRPFKTVESELKAKARASSSGTSTPTAQKKKGRPLKIRHQLFIAQPLPEFHPFKCEWKGCEAELHNLETLRLHLHIVHKKRVEGKVPCLWAKCAAKKVIEGEDGERRIVDDHPRFTSRQAWKDHLEAKHLIPFSWHMGDGPKGTDLSGKLRGIINPLWLNDENGNEVTPSVKGQALEEGRASDLNKKRFRKMKGMNIFKEKAEKKKDMKGMGGMGMLPPQVSSDDEDEDTGADEVEPEVEDEGDIDSEVLEERRGGERQVVRLDDDDDMDSDGERDEDIDENGDVQMSGP